MIADFLASWPLFADAWLASWLMAPLLGLLGVVLAARRQLFLGAAMGQAATLGVAVFLLVAGCGHGAVFSAKPVLAVAGATVTALVCGGRDWRDAGMGWIFCAAGAGAVLLVAHSPHGAEEVNRLLASSIVGAGRSDVVVLALLLAVVVATVVVRGDALRAQLIDEPFAAAIGMAVRRWNIAIALVLGLGVGWSLQVAGLLFVVGALMLPALAARRYCRTVAGMAWCAPLLALVCALAGAVLANAWDLPPSQVVVALMALAVPVGTGLRMQRAMGQR